MKFTLSTKPLNDGLSLGVIKSNVSKFYQKSTLAEITADSNTLRINLEAASITSELTFKGVSEGEGPESIFVDCITLRDLVATLDTNTVTLEYTDGGMIVHSGKSKFTLPQVIEKTDIELNRPSAVPAEAEILDLNKSDWKFVDDHQMYAIAMSFVHPIYTNVWVGDSGDVLVGDFESSIFTRSNKSKLNNTCLLQDTAINLFNSLPEGSKIIKLDKSYLIKLVTDSYEYSAEFTPKYESDEGVGTYSAELILGMLTADIEKSVKVNVSKMNKALNQAILIYKDAEAVISFVVKDKEVILRDDSINCIIDLDKSAPTDYELKFKTLLLKNMLSNMDEEIVYIMPTMQGDTIVGIVCWTDNMSVVLASIEE